MRMLLFFDLPRDTSAEVTAANRFVRELKKEGFLMLQESVYCKLLLNMSAYEPVRKEIEKIKPEKGNIFLLTITEKQFSSIEIVLGEVAHKEFDSFERLVVL